MTIDHNEQTKTLDNVFDWSEHYLERYDKISRESNPEIVKIYRIELGGFISYVFSRWMGTRLSSLKQENQELLNDVYRKLASIELQTATKIVELNRDQDAKKKVESINLPSDADHSSDISYAGWRISPLHYGEKLLKKISRALLPQ